MRDNRLDNFKFILITCVVLGHTIEPLIGRFEWLKSLYEFFYMFHIPMFAYASGVVAKSIFDKATLNKIISNLVIPYIILELLYSLADYYFFSGKAFTLSLLIPYWIMWYLFSLIIWKLLLPLFDQFRFPVLVSFILGILCGLNAYGYNLSFSRTFVFFPLFLMGHYYHPWIISTLHRFKLSYVIGSVILIGSLCVLVIFPDSYDLSVHWLYGSFSYKSLNTPWQQGFMIRGLLYMIAIILGLSVLAITPKSKSVISYMGKHSFFIYVLHGFVIKTLLTLGAFHYINNNLKATVLILLSLLLLPLLSNKFIQIFWNQVFSLFGLTQMLLKKV